MNPSVQRIAEPVVGTMDSRVRRGVVRRIAAMERELKFIAERGDADLSFIRRRGWSDDHLHLVFLLNSVYQQVLGPMQAAARGGPEGLGSTIPVRYGKASFSRETTRSVQSAMRDFMAMVDGLKLQRSWLRSNTCGDIVFVIASLESDTTRG